MTITLECPWCDGRVALDDEANLVTCDACGVVSHLSTEEPAVLAAAA
jgi:primosomal protein N'